jgi:uncharacterized protein YqeY
VLVGYLPAQLSDEEIAGIVGRAVAEVRAAGADGPAAMGRVMKLVQPQTKGRADGARVAAEVRRQLGTKGRADGGPVADEVRRQLG